MRFMCAGTAAAASAIRSTGRRRRSWRISTLGSFRKKLRPTSTGLSARTGRSTKLPPRPSARRCVARGSAQERRNEKACLRHPFRRERPDLLRILFGASRAGKCELEEKGGIIDRAGRRAARCWKQCRIPRRAAALFLPALRSFARHRNGFAGRSLSRGLGQGLGMALRSSSEKTAEARARYETERVSERLRELRLGRKLKMRRLAELSKVPARTVSKIGERQLRP